MGETQEDDDDRRTRSLGGLAVALFVLVLGLFVVQKVSATFLQRHHCPLKGRSECGVMLGDP
jgi:hypothetical protein